MPSSYSARLRFELQFTGENVNTWGVRLNTVVTRVDFAIAGMATVPMSGVPYSLTASNTADDESRAAILKLTGTGGGEATIPAVTKKYTVWNTNTGAVTLTAGGDSVAIDPGDVVDVICDGTDVLPLGFADSGGNLLSIKQWIDAAALASLTGLPAAAGNTGKYLYSNGATWIPRLPVTTDLSDYTSDQATKTAAARGEAIAFAVAL